MSTKKTNTGNFMLGILAIAAVLLFPITAAGLILFALFGKDSANRSYWNAVGDVRGENYSDPYVSHRKR